MSKVYGQKPSSAISAVARHDEFKGSVSEQDTNFARSQSVAQIGETLPIVFCWREGGDGGVWVSPYLVGIGFEGDIIHLVYAISQGQIGEIRDNEIWVGYDKFTDFLEYEASIEYEQLPAGTKIDNRPGRIVTIRSNMFYLSDSSGSEQYSYVDSVTGNCTGMEFVMHSNERDFSLVIAVYEKGNDFEYVKEVTLEFTNYTQTREITGLNPGRYLFVIEVEYLNAYSKISLVGTVEHYNVDDSQPEQASYKDMTLLALKAEITDFLQDQHNNSLVQLHAFVRDGIYVEDVRSGGATGPTSLYPNLVNYLMTNGIELDPDLIDVSSLALIANMNHKYKLFFNGSMQSTSSYQEWVFKTAPYFWASPAQINGKYGLAPVVPLSPDGSVKTSVSPIMQLGLDQIIEGSYNMVMESSKERQDFCCVMIYKGSITRSISETKTVEVRYKGAALNGPFETHDLTEFCIDEEHAIRAAMYILARRRYVTHTLNVTIRPQTIQLNPGDVIQADLEISGGTKNKYFYQVDSISEGPDGLVSLSLTHFPVNAQGQSLIALAITQELTNELTEGRSRSQNQSNDTFVWQ